jgi:hypothetical protein
MEFAKLTRVKLLRSLRIRGSGISMAICHGRVSGGFALECNYAITYLVVISLSFVQVTYESWCVRIEDIMIDIHIKTIPHREHRYPTLGDYWRDADGKQQVRISEMGNDDYAFLIIIHELIEWYITEKRGIKEEDIKAFDEKFEQERMAGLHGEKEEAGFDPRAPYVKEHTFATNIEKQIAQELGVAWEMYASQITKLFAQLEASADTKAGAGND